MTVLIFANGELSEGPWIQPYIQDASAIIAADGGAVHLQNLGLTPDWLIGDLDSVGDELVDTLVQAGVHVNRHRLDKDETDLELSLLFAHRNFDKPILVLGATGGRIDHSLANLMLLSHPDFLEVDISYIDRGYRIWAVHKQTSIVGEPGDLISLVPVNDSVTVRSTRGLRWPLSSETLDFGRTRGVSNELTGQNAEVELESGTLICIHNIKNKNLDD